MTPSVGVVATRRPTEHAKVEKDITVRLRIDGQSVTTFDTVVFAPDAAEQIGGHMDAADGNGYITQYLFAVVDQFGIGLPRPTPGNETFGQVFPDNTYENWIAPSPVFLGTNGSGQINDVYGHRGYFKADLTTLLVPLPLNPFEEGWTDPVRHFEQKYYIGSTQSGRGVLVKTHTVQDYRGKSRVQ